MVNSGSLAPNANGRYQTGSQPGVAGVPFWAFGPGNFACDLPGSTFIDCPGTFLNIAGPLTLIAWVNVASPTGGNQSILNKGSGSYHLLLDGGGLPHFADGTQPSGDVIGPSPVTDGQWHQLAGIYDGTNTQSLYVDGQLVTSAAGATTPVAGNSLDVWLGDAPDNPGVESLNGVVDEVAIFTSALSAGQIQQLYFMATNFPPSPVLTGISRTQAGVVTLNWTTVPGYVYQIQSASTLKPPAWTNLTTVTASGSSLTTTDTTAQSTPRFYRALIPQ
jgi:hypothetical protein